VISAYDHKISLSPVSQGKNLDYGQIPMSGPALGVAIALTTYT
jgi:hypothetical protein